MQTMIRIGTFGSNGHQIHQEIARIQGAAFTACCDTPAIENMGNVQIHEHFEDLVANPDIDLISICAPVRAQQGRWIKQALLAGKHVYVEKPCVMTGAELDECLDLANHCGRELLEMSGTAFE
ncbi:MAG: Gfo/Idh/MocA family oxidoreductase, partial [Anaerolineae bacterium]|nr:Gfo/Idh/MocA family oxidoreductase [Anaerolineae bacterium]